MADKPCTILIFDESGDPANSSDLKKAIESGDDNARIDALKKIIHLTQQGEKLPGVLVFTFRFLSNCKNHTIKKLLLLYWEIVEKTGPDGKLLPEMILACNALMTFLKHPNEYVRGSTLRFMAKLQEGEMLEPLIPAIKQNLEHRHSYVKRNAIVAIHSIYKDQNLRHLIPDAPEILLDFLAKDEDSGCKRNAFLMLSQCAQDKAIEYLDSVLDQVPNFSDIQQFVAIDLIKKISRPDTPGKNKYLRCVASMVGSNSPAVQYEVASALLALSPTPGVVRIAATNFIQLLCNQSENNVKLIVLDRLVEIKKNHSKVLQDLLMEILRALASPTIDIRKKTLDLAMDLVTPRNIDDVVQLLKKEINKTQTGEFDKAGAYRQMLVQAIHSCAVKFPDVASSVVHALMDYVGDSNVASAVDVIDFVSEVVETYPDRRQAIVRKLLETLEQVKSPTVFRASLWIVGEYSDSKEDIDFALTTIIKELGERPFYTEHHNAEATPEETKKVVAPTGPKVLADGTYASQSAFQETVISDPINGTSLRTLLLDGDFFLGAVIGTTLTKLALKLLQSDVDPVVKHSVVADVMSILTSMVLLGQHGKHRSDPDSHENMMMCLRILSHPNTPATEIFLKEPRKIFAKNLEAKRLLKSSENQKKVIEIQADDLITFRLLRSRQVVDGPLSNDDEVDLMKATGNEEDDRQTSLQRVHQLTGFSDPLYAEAYVHVHRYDIVLDVMVINRTKDTLQNVSLELATLGDLKLCERPQTYTIGPNDKIWIKANIKVSSTESGVIFGNLVYDIAGSSSSDKNCVVLNDVRIDVMDYIKPAYCSEVMFRVMWAEFEWENKVIVSSNISNCQEFLEHILAITNMRCLTPKAAIEGDCGFLSANLYARSIFGEDALANVSVEELPDGKVSGYVRIRSKKQGIAVGLGDKITLKHASKDA